LAPEGVPPVSGTGLRSPCPGLPGPCSQFVGGSCGLSFASTTLYGLPHGSDSTASISSFQDRSFAALISRCSAFLASLWAAYIRETSFAFLVHLRRWALANLLRAWLHCSLSSAISGFHQYAILLVFLPMETRGIAASHTLLISSRRSFASSSTVRNLATSRPSQLQAALVAATYSASLSLSFVPVFFALWLRQKGFVGLPCSGSDVIIPSYLQFHVHIEVVG
jgi:hypothetical protein